MELRMLSSNEHKIKETEAILGSRFQIIPVREKLEELQTEDTERLVRDKLLRAFKSTGRPVFVEHTGLYIDHLGGLPGGLTQLFWDKLGPDRFSDLFGKTANTAVKAETVIGYCDAKSIHFFRGHIDGNISPTPCGPRDFQWDCVFIPSGDSKTFAEMGSAAKNAISMRKIALEQFAKHLGGRP